MILALSSTFLALVTSQTATTTVSTEMLLRAVEAAERAAKAAQAAAEASAAAVKATPAVVAPAAEATPAEPPKVQWASTIGFGLIWLAGNSETLTFSGNANIERKSEDWIFSAKAFGAYGESLPASSAATEPEIVALNAGLQLRGDRRFTPTITGYIAPGIDMDHVKSIEYRASAEAGTSFTWFEEKIEDLVKSSLRTDLAMRYTKESRFQYFPVHMQLPDVDLLAPRLGVAFRYAISKDVLFFEDAEVLPNIIGESRVLLNSLSKLTLKLTSVLSFAVALDLKFDSLPAEGKEDLDSALTLGLELGL